MKLSKRLQAVADLVTPGSRVADVGCDHAYLSIYLAENKISPHIIAMDINQGPIDRARENIVKYGYGSVIEIRRSDGLEKLAAGEADTILIAGMGGDLTLRILEAGLPVAAGAREVILQPQSELGKVRAALAERHFLIVQENMVKEDGKYYVMMRILPESKLSEPRPSEPKLQGSKQQESQPSEPKPKELKQREPHPSEPMHAGSKCPERQMLELTEPEHFFYGRYLLEHKHEVLYEFLNWELGLNEAIFAALEAEQTERAILRREEITEKIAGIHRALEYYK